MLVHRLAMYFNWSCFVSMACLGTLVSLLLVTFFVSGFPYWWVAVILCIVILIGCFVWPISSGCFKLRPQATDIDSDNLTDSSERAGGDERQISRRERMARAPCPASSKHLGLWADEIDSYCPQGIQQENDTPCELPTCAICLEDIEMGSMKRALQGCGHEFHSDCIIKWIVRKASCPLCNMALKSKTELPCESEVIAITAANLNVSEGLSSHVVIELGQDQDDITEAEPVGRDEPRETTWLIASEGRTTNPHTPVANLSAVVLEVPPEA
mmetsp:Transcript_17109/g.29868  ORF Transcript_17109/g.29868 Transcript_17109/m.29868 type:complete len:270 (-) Transcript_17109:684-1493(-)